MDDNTHVEELLFASEDMWVTLKNHMMRTGVSASISNSLVQSESSSNDYIWPYKSEVHWLCRIANTSIARLYKETYGEDLISADSKLWLFSKLTEKEISLLSSIIEQLIDGDHCYFFNTSRTIEHFAKDRMPDGESYFSHLQWVVQRDSTIDSKPAPSGCRPLVIRNSGRYIDIPKLKEIATEIGVSLRWLYQYDGQSSFYGLDPKVETLYDKWTIAQPYTQELIASLAAEFVKGAQIKNG